MATLGDLVVRIGADTRNLNKELGRVQRNMRSMTSNLTRMGQSMSSSITLPVLAIGGAALKSAADLETLETSFISLTGGAEQAAGMMKQLNEFTAKTPFQIEAVAKSARQLIASGTGIDEVNGQLQFLGDIAATSGTSIDDIAAIFAKVNAKGKVELDNLNQLAERGIPIFEALSEATGLPASALGAGAVSVEQFNQVLQGFSEEGGFAAGAMLRLSNTVSGKFSTAMDNAKLAMASLGEQLLPIASKALDTFTSLAQKFTQLDAGTKRIALGIGAVTAAIGPMLVILPQLIAGFVALTSPISLTIGAIAALTAAFVYFWDDIKPLITNVINLMITLYNNIVPLRVAVAFVKTAFLNAGKAIYTAFQAVLGTFSTLLDVINKIMRGDFSGAADAFVDGFKEVGSEIWSVGTDIGRDMVEAVNEAIYAEPIELLDDDALPSKADIMDKFHNLFSGTGAGIASGISSGAETAETATRDLLSRLTNMTVEGIDTTLGTIEENAIPSIQSLLAELEEVTVKPMENMTKKLGESYQTMIDIFVDGIEDVITGTKSLKSVIIEVAKQIIIARLAETKANVLKGASSFAASMGPAAPFVLGATLAGMMAIVNRIQIPALAEGGLAFGPSMALIGDNPNARVDPEVIAPLSKLKDMMGGNQVEVFGRISGNDIYISNSRTMTARERYS